MSDDQIIAIIREDIMEMRKDIKKLLAFRHKLTGIVIGVSGLVSFLVTYLPKFLT